MASLYAFLKKRSFTSFQSVFGYISVHRHNVNPCFCNHWLFQLSLPTSKLLFFFTRTYDNLRNTIVCRDIRINYSSVKHCVFSKRCIPHHTSVYQFLVFDFPKMCNVLGFRSAGHSWNWAVVHEESFYPEGNCSALRWNDQKVVEPL